MSLITRLLGFSFFALSTTVQAAEIPASALTGNLSVSPMGAATYSIPLALPAGVNGATPKLSLEYNSQSGMGIAGMGWNIGGLSAITRCPQSKAVDGVQKALTLSIDDRFCMDGQRLILTSGTYGAAGSTYQSEINNFARVTALTNPNNNSLIYFKVETKDGKVLEYGSRTDAVLQPNAAGKANYPLVWMISNAYDKDQKGQLIAYDYANDNANGQQTLTRVRYAFDVNNANNLAEVVFDYDTTFQSLLIPALNYQYLASQSFSLPPISKYQAGSLIKLDKNLKSISIKTKKDMSSSFDNNSIYSLKYNTALNTRKSRLEKIDLCFENGNCTSPFKITYKDAYVYPDFNNSTSINGQYPAAIAWANNQVYPRYIVDINGDAYPDIIQFDWSGFTYYLNQNGAGFSSYHIVNGVFNNSFAPGGSPGTWSWSYPESFPRYIVDIDNDGYPDIVGFGWQDVFVNKNNKGNGFLSEQIIFHSFTQGNGWFGVNEHPRSVVDVDNDSYPDIVGFKDDGVYIALNNKNSGFNAAERKIENFGRNHGWPKNSTHPRFIVDIDNDGFKDIIGFKDDGVYLSKNNNMVFSAPERVLNEFGVSQGLKNMDEYPRFILDINGDGYVDIIGFSDNGVEASLNDGTGKFIAKSKKIDFFKTKSGWYADDWISNKKSPRTFSDINNDGLVDIIGFHNYKDVNDQYRCKLYVAINNGNTFDLFPYNSNMIAGCNSTPSAQDNADATKYPIYLADMNADGFQDIFYVSPEGLFVSLNKNVGNIDKVTQIEQSFNKFIIEYGISSNTNLYKKEDATYPNVSISTPFYLVQSVASSNGVGSEAYTDYKYTNMLFDYLRGNKGFKTVSSMNRDTKIKTESVYNQEFPYIGAMIAQRTGYCATAACLAASTIYPFVAQSGLSVLSSTVNIFDNQVTNGSTANQKIYFPYIKSSTTTTYEPPAVGQ